MKTRSKSKIAEDKVTRLKEANAKWRALNTESKNDVDIEIARILIKISKGKTVRFNI
jgi:hypothetical protein